MESPFTLSPFGVTPDARFVYLHPRFREAREALLTALLEGKGFVVITGEVGAGKTTLMRTVLGEPTADLECAAVLNTGLAPDDLLLAVAGDLEVEIPPGTGRTGVITAIQERLLATYAHGKRTAIFVDEAQHLSDESLELLRMLSNLETESEKLVQIVLFGQVELRDRLGRPELRQLRSRIAVHRHLEPLTSAETAAYVKHRLEQAGASIPVDFQTAAVAALHGASRGLPRRINLIADGALRRASAGVTQGRIIVTKAHVATAAKELASLDPTPWENFARTRLHGYSTAAAWGVLIAAVAYLVLRQAGAIQSAPMRRAAPPPEASFAPVAQIPAGLLPPPAPAANPAGTVLLDLFALAGQAPPYDAEAIARMRPEAAAEAAGMTWIDLPSDPKLLAGIGLPAFAFLARLDGTLEPVVLKPVYGDSPSAVAAQVEVRPAIGSPRIVPWDGISLSSTRPGGPPRPGILLPAGIWDGIFLRAGSRGPRVRRLQEALVRLGYLARPERRFGPRTLTAVIRFQADRGILEDGVVGPWTLSALHAAGSLSAASETVPASPAR